MRVGIGKHVELNAKALLKLELGLHPRNPGHTLLALQLVDGVSQAMNSVRVGEGGPLVVATHIRTELLVLREVLRKETGRTQVQKVEVVRKRLTKLVHGDGIAINHHNFRALRVVNRQRRGMLRAFGLLIPQVLYQVGARGAATPFVIHGPLCSAAVQVAA